jgi:hypothetical protein
MTDKVQKHDDSFKRKYWLTTTGDGTATTTLFTHGCNKGNLMKVKLSSFRLMKNVRRIDPTESVPNTSHEHQ